jgi:hypothetical protein
MLQLANYCFGYSPESLFIGNEADSLTICQKCGPLSCGPHPRDHGPEATSGSSNVTRTHLSHSRT